jgi:Icc-related predicted phosphoesterase
MKILPLSDLHVDCYKPQENVKLLLKIEETKPEVIISAGDEGELRRDAVRQFVKDLCKIAPVVFVKGNHSFWYSDKNDVDSYVKELKLSSNFNHLHYGKTLTINGQKFIGDTLWYPYTTEEKGFPDFRAIYRFRDWYGKDHDATVKYITENVDKDTIVVTHHLPSQMCIDKKYIDDTEWNYFFCHDMTGLIMDKQPKAWFFGHSHEPRNFKLGNSRLISNPRAYPGEEQDIKFDPKMIIDI